MQKIVCKTDEKILKNKSYRKPWIVGSVILSILIFFMGMITPINMNGALSSSIVLLVFLYLAKKKEIIKEERNRKENARADRT